MTTTETQATSNAEAEQAVVRICEIMSGLSPAAEPRVRASLHALTAPDEESSTPSVSTADSAAAPANVVRLSRAEFDALGEYSCSFPTLTTIGKRWKRNETAYNHLRGLPPEPERWLMGEYYEIGDPNRVGIRWLPIEIVEAPALARRPGGEGTT